MMDDDFQNSPFSIVLIVPGSRKAIQVEQISPETTTKHKRATVYIFGTITQEHAHATKWEIFIIWNIYEFSGFWSSIFVWLPTRCCCSEILRFFRGPFSRWVRWRFLGSLRHCDFLGLTWPQRFIFQDSYGSLLKMLQHIDHLQLVRFGVTG